MCWCQGRPSQWRGGDQDGHHKQQHRRSVESGSLVWPTTRLSWECNQSLRARLAVSLYCSSANLLAPKCLHVCIKAMVAKQRVFNIGLRQFRKRTGILHKKNTKIKKTTTLIFTTQNRCLFHRETEKQNEHVKTRGTTIITGRHSTNISDV